jgi:hypothetical protein
MTQLILILICGFIGFSIQTLWVSLYLQQVKKLGPLNVAVHLLPMAITGTIINVRFASSRLSDSIDICRLQVIAGFTMHRVSNKLLVGIGASSYLIAFILAAVNRSSNSYWSFLFPSLVLVVLGADFEFCVTNVCTPSLNPLE